MLTRMIIRTIFAGLAMLVLTAGVALAKPGHGEGKVTITGPGINGVIEITDMSVLEGADPYQLMLEATPYIEKAPQWTEGAGYELTYSFQNGKGVYEVTDRIRYIPGSNSEPGYIYLSLYPPQTTGTWFQISPEGERAMRGLLTQVGVAVVPENASPAEAVPVADAPAPIPVTPRESLPTGWIALAVALAGLLALGGILRQLRTQASKA
jgi:hypothetical protein